MIKAILKIDRQVDPIELDLPNFTILDESLIEFPDIGFFLRIGKGQYCIDCFSKLGILDKYIGDKALIRQTSARSDGIGGMECNCSYWETSISMGSGSAFTSSRIRRNGPISDKDKADRILRDLDQGVKDELKDLLK